MRKNRQVLSHDDCPVRTEDNEPELERKRGMSLPDETWAGNKILSGHNETAAEQTAPLRCVKIKTKDRDGRRRNRATNATKNIDFLLE